MLYIYTHEKIKVNKGVIWDMYTVSVGTGFVAYFYKEQDAKEYCDLRNKEGVINETL